MSGPDDTALTGAVLFTDLVGFTEYTDAIGDDGALVVVDAQTALASEVLRGIGEARIVKELGDGLLIWCSGAAEGLRGAVALMEEMRKAHADGSFPLPVRMGLHHGSAVARGEDLVGQTVNVAARVADLAGPGELLVSDDVVEACADDDLSAALRAVGPVSVRGVQAPVWLQRLGG